MSESSRIVLRADVSELDRLHGWIERLCREHQFSDRLSMHLDLCAAEVVTNVIHYGYAGMQSPDEAIAVQFSRTRSQVSLEIVDRGVEFDPAAYLPPPPPRSIDEAPTGGRGLILVRQFTEDVRYRREDGCNRLVLIFSAPQCTL